MIRAQNEPDSDKRAELVSRARDDANRAELLGRNTESLNSMLEILSNKDLFLKRSDNAVIADWMRKGETAFAGGDHQGALDAYAKALEIGPKLYDAAVFSGDVYWADGLLQQNKLAEAKRLYIDAVLAQSYTKEETDRTRQSRLGRT